MKFFFGILLAFFLCSCSQPINITLVGDVVASGRGEFFIKLKTSNGNLEGEENVFECLIDGEWEKDYASKAPFYYMRGWGESKSNDLNEYIYVVRVDVLKFTNGIDAVVSKGDFEALIKNRPKIPCHILIKNYYTSPAVSNDVYLNSSDIFSKYL